jgi:Rrf2 family protein
MLTATSELGVKALLVVALEGRGEPLSPAQLSQLFDCSRSYLAKILNQLVKADLLRSVRGARGGVLLERPPEEITLLAIVEACQGLLVGNYCRGLSPHDVATCAFHRAMEDVYQATREALTRWTLADLMEVPTPGDLSPQGPPCKMAFRGWEKYRQMAGGGPASELPSEGGG